MPDTSDARAARTPRESQRRWLTHRKERDPDARPDITVGVAASFTAEPLEAQLGAALLDTGFATPAIHFADYNQLHQVCLDPSAQLGDVDHLLMLWRIEDVFERPFGRFLAGDDEAGAEILAGTAELAALVGQLDHTTTAGVILSTPPHPAGWDADLEDVATSLRVGRLHRAVCASWLDALASAPEIAIVDLDALQRAYGAAHIFDAQKWAMYRQPYTSEFWFVLGEHIEQTIRRRTQPAPKCIVLDCDNTLWGGIVGEDGLGGLDLSDTFPGRAFQAFQRELRVLRTRGVMLAVASKNNAAEVFDVFDHHESMVLTRDDITAWRVDWQPKSANLESIAAELNIGIDSIVLVDDSPFELDEVATALPGVRGLLVPEELAELPALLRDSGLFRGLRVSGEDRHRTEMMQAEAQRRAELGTMDRGEFLASLELRVAFLRVSDDHVARVAQLTNKTNQFNLTTIRRDEKQIRGLVASDANEVYAIRVTDRFGDYGIVGTAIVDRSAEVWTIDTFLMSCRVLGRGVESAFLAAVADAAAAGGATQLVGRYEPTRKNSQVATFYAAHGFVAVSDAPGTFSCDLGRTRLEKPAHIELVG